MVIEWRPVGADGAWLRTMVVWTPLILGNGWRCVPGPFQWPGWYVDGGVWLHLRGAVVGGEPGSVIAVLPPGARPARSEFALMGRDGQRLARCLANGWIEAPRAEFGRIELLDRIVDLRHDG